jgi:hypothetical protein
MTITAEHAARNQHVLMLVLGLTVAKALVRNRSVVMLGLAGVAHAGHRKGAATSAALRRRAAANMSAWRHS